MDFEIKKGSNYATGFHFELTFSNEISFKAKFDENCLYDLGTSDNYDINKLYGFSTSYHHHKQSARFGWRCIDGENIQILTYTYDKGKRMEPTLLGTILPGQEIIGSIKRNKSSYTFEFLTSGKEKKVIIPISQNCWYPRYILWPYFGGNMPAPHDMSLEVSSV